MFDQQEHRVRELLRFLLPDLPVLGDLIHDLRPEGLELVAGLLLRATDWINIGLAGYNLVSKKSSQYPRGVGGGITIRPVPTLGISGDAVWDLDAPMDRPSGRYGFGGEYFFSSSNQQNGFPIRAGGIFDKGLDKTYVTGGVGFVSQKIGIDIGMRKEVDGGNDLMVLGSLRVFGPSGV